ncbi:hypothetical protein YC2023_117243 [Brassica napus]
MSPSSYHSVEPSMDRLRRGSHILRDDVIGRRNITRILSRISQPQPPGGKKQLFLTGHMVRTAGNTSPWEDSTILTSVARFDAGITYESLLVLKQGTTSSGRVYNFDELQKLEEPEEKFVEILQAYHTTTKSRSAKGTLPKRREHCCSTSCKGAMENANTTSRTASLHILYSFGGNGRERSRKTHVSTTIHPKEKAKPPGSGFQLPEDTTTRKAWENKLSVNPRGNTHQKSHQHAHGKGDSRRRDKSSSDVQKMLGVARLSQKTAWTHH